MDHSESARIARLDHRKLLGVALVLLLGTALRFVDVLGSVTDQPFRSDAAVYYQTAYNLNHYGVYSHASTHPGDTAPAPDAFVTPGYPLFLTLFVHHPAEDSVFHSLALWQALIGSLTLLLVFWLFDRVAGYVVGLLAMLLTAVSPHQVNSVLFMVTETWFTLLLMAALTVFSLYLSDTRRLQTLFIAGALFGAAALTRPVLELFPLCLAAVMFISHPRRQALMGGSVLLAGFVLLWAPWIVRNEVSLSRAGDSTVMVNTLTAGMYPDFEYDHNPASLGRPYRWDPRSAEINHDLKSALKEIGQRFREHPGEELEWYLLGKPVMLWSWDIIEGGWDAYIYPVYRGSPYDTDPIFRVTHAIARLLHWPLVVLAFVTAIYSWLPGTRRQLPGPALALARTVGLLLFYNTAVLMALAPFTRYSIPFLPLVFGMAMLGGWLLWQWDRSRKVLLRLPARTQ